MTKDKIRGLSVAIIRNGGRILVSPGYDKAKDEAFYRLVGGGIEFGENSLNALKREFMEELGVGLKDCKLITIKENIFTYNGEQGHEICFIYEAGFDDVSYYQNEEFKIADSDLDSAAIWLETDKLKDSRVFPEGVSEFI